MVQGLSGGDRMSDIRSVVMPKTIDGKVYPLTVNYNVIADIQAELGDLRELLKPSNYLKVASVALAAMLNEAAYQMKRPDRFDSRSVAQYFPPITDMAAATTEAVEIVKFVLDAMIDPEEAGDAPEGSAEKN